MFMVLLKSKKNISLCTHLFFIDHLFICYVNYGSVQYLKLNIGGCHITIMDIKRWTLTSISGQPKDSWNHLANGSILCFISILDNWYSVLITIISHICYAYWNKNILFFNTFQLILLCLIVPKMQNVVTKYVVCYSNNYCFMCWLLQIIIKH